MKRSAVPVGCWPNANAANSSRPRAFFFFLPRASLLFVFWTSDGPRDARCQCQAPCGPVRPQIRPHAPCNPEPHAAPAAPCGPMHRGFPLGPQPAARGRQGRQARQAASGKAQATSDKRKTKSQKPPPRTSADFYRVACLGNRVPPR
jgi:hypothetical protein